RSPYSCPQERKHEEVVGREPQTVQWSVHSGKNRSARTSVTRETARADARLTSGEKEKNGDDQSGEGQHATPRPLLRPGGTQNHRGDGGTSRVHRGVATRTRRHHDPDEVERTET